MSNCSNIQIFGEEKSSLFMIKIEEKKNICWFTFKTEYRHLQWMLTPSSDRNRQLSLEYWKQTIALRRYIWNVAQVVKFQAQNWFLNRNQSLLCLLYLIKCGSKFIILSSPLFFLFRVFCKKKTLQFNFNFNSNKNHLQLSIWMYI